MNNILKTIKEKLVDLSWKYPRATLYVLGILTGLLLAFIF